MKKTIAEKYINEFKNYVWDGEENEPFGVVFDKDITYRDKLECIYEFLDGYSNECEDCDINLNENYNVATINFTDGSTICIKFNEDKTKLGESLMCLDTFWELASNEIYVFKDIDKYNKNLHQENASQIKNKYSDVIKHSVGDLFEEKYKHIDLAKINEQYTYEVDVHPYDLSILCDRYKGNWHLDKDFLTNYGKKLCKNGHDYFISTDGFGSSTLNKEIADLLIGIINENNEIMMKPYLDKQKLLSKEKNTKER